MIPRRLMHRDLTDAECVDSDVLVLGCGVAGLSAALAVDDSVRVTAISKGPDDTSNTFYAQGGVAAVMDDADTSEQHTDDTLLAGAGLCDSTAVDRLVQAGPERIRALIDLGAQFDREDGRLRLGSEGGHSQRRVLHADGDRTGREVIRTMSSAARARSNCRMVTGVYGVDLLSDDGACGGAVCVNMKTGQPVLFRAPVTILATGGTGQLYRETSNPGDATGDGVAMAFRAGADCIDMEFVQFHPTTLYLAGAPRMLISEAVRGEGAHLLDGRGRRFMESVHAHAELAVRDIVARAIMDAVERTGSVTLSLAHCPAERVRKRFPNLTEFLGHYGLDMARDPIPVRPAAHYLMGGVATDLEARTSLPGLLACGESGCTGVHGANRLASNSILEGLVFGHQAGCTAQAILAKRPPPMRPPGAGSGQLRIVEAPLDIDDLLRSLKATMWRNAGLLRSGVGLSRAQQMLAFWQGYVHQVAPQSPAAFGVENMLTSARLIVHGALMRTESRGAHWRTDYPKTDDANWKRRITVNISDLE